VNLTFCFFDKRSFNAVVFGFLLSAFISLNQTHAGKSYNFLTRDGRPASIELIEKIDEINEVVAKKVLIDSFTTEYQSYLQPWEIRSDLKFWLSETGVPSVEQFYSDYFDSEYRTFRGGNLFWVQAKIDDSVVGWATFEREKSQINAVYMDLLIVSPRFQRQGIGEQLIHSLIRLEVLPNLKTINLLLRKTNVGGHVFYPKLGFKFSPEYVREYNFVGMNVLEGWSLNLDS
jgi:GNAT superfamily N-acetyltransferase